LPHLLKQMLIPSGRASRRPSAQLPIRPRRFFLCGACCLSSPPSNLCHPLPVAGNAPKQCRYVQVDIQIGPVQTCSAAENFYVRDLICCGRFKSLQVFARNHVPVAIAQFEHQQIQPRTRHVFDFVHDRFASQSPGMCDRAIDFGVGGRNSCSTYFLLDCFIRHGLTPITPPDRQNVWPQPATPSLHPIASHLRAGQHRLVSPRQRSGSAAGLQWLPFRQKSRERGAADDRLNTRRIGLRQTSARPLLIITQA